MNESQALAKMISPGMVRHGKPAGGVIQIWVTRVCDKSCFGCTQGSNLRIHSERAQNFIKPDQFETAVKSLKGYFGTIGMFGGNPAAHPEFERLCDIFAEHIPLKQRGLWCNNLLGQGIVARRTFNPAVSNLNVHLDQKAYDEFRRDWPEARPFGLKDDSRHSPVYVSMKDLGVPEEERWELISKCDINQHWSAMIGVFRGNLRGYFCEIAGSMSMLHQNDPNWPDTGVPIEPDWWKKTMDDFAPQVGQHCHDCGVPLRGYGSLAQHDGGIEQVSETHLPVYQLKTRDRRLQVVDDRSQLGEQSLKKMTDYVGNAKR